MRRKGRTSLLIRSALTTLLFASLLRASKDCETHFVTGLSRYRSHQLTEALVELQTAVGCDPKNVNYRLALAEAYMQKGDDNKALLTLQQALQVEPRNQTALAEEGSLYLRHEMNAEAVAALKNLVAVSPQDPKAYTDLGAAYAGLFDFENARSNFSQALRLKPDDASALTGLGHAELKADHAEAAVELFTRAIKAAPKAYEPHYLRGVALNGMNRNKEAFADLKTAVELGGRDPEIYYRLAQVDRALGKTEDSREALSKFTALRSQSNGSDDAKREAARLTAEAKQKIEQGQLTAAIDLLKHVVALEGETPRSLFRLASLYFDTEQYGLAQQYDRKAIDLDPSEWTQWYLLGLIERKAGRPKEATEALQTALKLNPASVEVKNQLGELAREQAHKPPDAAPNK